MTDDLVPAADSPTPLLGSGQHVQQVAGVAAIYAVVLLRRGDVRCRPVNVAIHEIDPCPSRLEARQVGAPRLLTMIPHDHRLKWRAGGEHCECSGTTTPLVGG